MEAMYQSPEETIPLEFGLSSTEQRYADALVEVAEHYLANGPGKCGRRYEVVLTIGRNELARRTNAGGARYHVDPDWGVDEEDARQIACDADITEFIQDAWSPQPGSARAARAGACPSQEGATCSTTSAASASSRRGCCGP